MAGKFNFKGETLNKQVFLRMGEEADEIKAIAKHEKVKISEVARAFMLRGLEEYKKGQKRG